MNDYQAYNKALEQKRRTGADGKTLADSFSNLLGFKCVSCGVEVSPSNIRYYNFDVTGVRCYTCQSKNL